MTFRNRSLEIPARAPFLIADTLDLATAERLTISLTVRPEISMDLAASPERRALYSINAISVGESMPRAFAISLGFFKPTAFFS